ncbi:Arc family DNA-binding protein [Acinetobacter sp. P8-3-8]|uniref:Arc family DNA-binding protein n=1 Tax=Acinetobacter sp. P8-3-8 TaxID=1029823 RepID=UPI0002487E4A|nr:Arc family DNA-binding protein [Acinetobacter sp. P8-3-8]
MSNQADHTIVRLRVPPELKQKIEESAEKNNRSQSAEMVARLEQSFEPEIQVHETLEFKLMMQSYLDQAEQIKELKTMLEQFLKKG